METQILTVKSKTYAICIDNSFSAPIFPIQKCISQLNEKLKELQIIKY